MIARVAVVVAAALAVGAVLGAERLPVAEVHAGEPYVGAVAPSVQPVACPGPVEIPVGEIDSGDPNLDSGSADVRYRAFGDSPERAGAGFLVREGVAASVQRVGSGDVAGLAAAACEAPARDQWLVGGSTSLGASSRLVLTNPTDTATEVTVVYYGPIGQTPERSVVTVAPGGQQDLLVEGVAAEVPALVAHVTATAAGVVAHLQDSRLDGFLAAGTDWVARGADPGELLVVPAVGTRGGETTLRLLAPEGATVELTLVGDRGIVAWGGVSALRLEPGVVTEVAVPAVASAAVEIRADGPVVAGAMTRIARAVQDGPANSRAYDLAWVAAQPVLDSVPRAVTATDYVTAVTVHALTAGTFELTDAAGEPVVTREMSARTTATVPLAVRGGTVLSSSAGRFTWALTAESRPGFLARLAPRRTDVEAVEILVERRSYMGVPVATEDGAQDVP